MAVTSVFCCGFECGVVATSATGPHWASSSTGSIVTTNPRSGARHGRSNNIALSGGLTTNAAILPTTGTWVARLYIYFVSLPTVDSPMIGDINLSTAAFFKQSDHSIYARANTTNGTSGIPVAINHWYRIDMKVDYTFNGAAGVAIDVWVDGVPVSRSTNTASGSKSTTFAIGVFGASATADVYFDDVVVSQTAADFPIGPGNVYCGIPAHDGTHNVAGANDFEFSATGTDITNATTTAFTLVDDIPLESGVPVDYINLIAPPNATDYVEVGPFDPAPGTPSVKWAPFGIECIIGYACSATGVNNLRVALVDNGSTDDIFNGNAALTSTNVKYARKHYTDPPSAATSWQFNVGNGQFQDIRMRCFTSDAAPDPFFVSAMYEAAFEDRSTPGMIILFGQTLV